MFSSYTSRRALLLLQQGCKGDFACLWRLAQDLCLSVCASRLDLEDLATVHPTARPLAQKCYDFLVCTLYNFLTIIVVADAYGNCSAVCLCNPCGISLWHSSSSNFQ